MQQQDEPLRKRTHYQAFYSSEEERLSSGSPSPSSGLPLPESSSRRMSASEAAKSGLEQWDTMAVRVKCDLEDIPLAVPEFDDILKEIKYPEFIIKDQKFLRFISRLEEEMLDSLRISRTSAGLYYGLWASALSDDLIHPGDPYMVEQWGYGLYSYWESNWTAHRKSGNEMELRHGIEGLIRLAFKGRLRAKHNYKAERDLFLPASPHTAKADIITTMRIPNDWIRFLDTLKNRHIFASEQKMGEVTTFACEAKCTAQTAASRQLSLYLCSAQHQRRALCFNNRPIYGATIVGNRFVMHSSEWVGDDVMVHPLQSPFDLNTFPTFIQCYLFLCKMADHIAEGVNKDFGTWGSEDTKLVHQNALRAMSNRLPWRLELKPWPDPKGLHTSYLGDGDDSGSDSVRGEMECVEMEDWELTGVCVGNKRPSPVTIGSCGSMGPGPDNYE